jgi:hypothetical protein
MYSYGYLPSQAVLLKDLFLLFCEFLSVHNSAAPFHKVCVVMQFEIRELR